MGKTQVALLIFCGTVLSAADVTVRLRWLEKPGRGIPPIHLNLDEYVAGVLAGEANEFRSPESLKAMAVAARTFAIRMRGRHKTEGFDFCDTTHCQDFRQAGITERLLAAARETSGEMLWYRGAVAATYYTKHCGGVRERSDAVWPDVVEPYLRSQRDIYCGPDEWSTDLTRDAIRKALVKGGLRVPPVIHEIDVAERTASNRAQRLMVNGIPMSASSFRFAIGRALGWDKVPSDSYTLSSTGAAFRFRGAGHGHGVGLCQSGAARMADGGKSYREILAYYYPGTILGLTASGLAWQTISGERVRVMTTQPDQDRELVHVADRAWSDVQQKLGITPNRTPTLRVHRTVPSYRDATGQPGWVAAFTSGTTVELQPLGVLRSQGGLESTVRHELAHVLVEQSTTAPLPPWLREGLALWLDGRSIEATSQPMSEADLNRNILRAATSADRRRAYAAAKAMTEACIRRYGRDAVFGWLKRGVPPELTYASVSQAVTTPR